MTRTTAMVYNMMNILSGFALMSALRYLSRMSFLTVVTPDTPRVISTALSIAARELTKPVNWTVPLKVSTLISADFSDGSLKIAVFTLVVMSVSSTYSPVPSFVDVPAHPSTATSRTAQTKAANPLNDLMTILPMKRRSNHLDRAGPSGAPFDHRYCSQHSTPPVASTLYGSVHIGFRASANLIQINGSASGRGPFERLATLMACPPGLMGGVPMTLAWVSAIWRTGRPQNSRSPAAKE